MVKVDVHRGTFTRPCLVSNFLHVLYCLLHNDGYDLWRMHVVLNPIRALKSHKIMHETPRVTIFKHIYYLIIYKEF